MSQVDKIFGYRDYPSPERQVRVDKEMKITPYTPSVEGTTTFLCTWEGAEGVTVPMVCQTSRMEDKDYMEARRQLTVYCLARRSLKAPEGAELKRREDGGRIPLEGKSVQPDERRAEEGK